MGMVIDLSASEVSELILRDVKPHELDVLRGQLLGLRTLWRELLNFGEVEGEPERDLSNREVNPLASMTEEDRNPLEYLTGEALE
jgi:hypothetical protein